MHSLLKKLGLGDTLAAIVMIIFGVVIWFYPDLVGKLVAVYLVLIGILKLYAGGGK